MKNRQKETVFFVLEEQKGWNLEPAAKIQRKKRVVSDHKSLSRLELLFRPTGRLFISCCGPRKFENKGLTLLF